MKVYKIVFVSLSCLFIMVGLYLDYYLKINSIYWSNIRSIGSLLILAGAIILDRMRVKKQNAV